MWRDGSEFRFKAAGIAERVVKALPKRIEGVPRERRRL